MTSNTKIKSLLFCMLLSGAGSALAQPAPITSVQPAVAAEAGLQAIEDEEFIKAVNIFEQAVLAHSDHVRLNRLLGIGYYKSGRNEAAIRQLEKTLKLATEQSLPDEIVATHYALGVVYLARASEVSVLKIRSVLGKSIDHLQQAVELNPEHVAARYYLIQVLINAPGVMGGDPERARELDRTLAEQSPLHHRIVSSTLAVKREDYASAEELLLESLRQKPDSALVNFALLSFYHDRKQYAQAIDFGESFLELPRRWDDTDAATAHFLLAECYQRQGQAERSLEHYALVLTHTENKKVIERVQDAVRELKGEA